LQQSLSQSRLLRGPYHGRFDDNLDPGAFGKWRGAMHHDHAVLHRAFQFHAFSSEMDEHGGQDSTPAYPCSFVLFVIDIRDDTWCGLEVSPAPAPFASPPPKRGAPPRASARPAPRSKIAKTPVPPAQNTPRPGTPRQGDRPPLPAGTSPA